jgi:hypothetical protein
MLWHDAWSFPTFSYIENPERLSQDARKTQSSPENLATCLTITAVDFNHGIPTLKDNYITKQL